MVAELLPWDLNRALLPTRLQAVAVEATQIRNRVIDLRVDGFDEPWCLSCRAYSWTCSALTQMSQRPDCRWLTVKKVGLEFTFYIDGIPIKFYRGNPDEPKANSLRSGVREMLAQRRLDFLEQEIREEVEGWFWLLAIDTDVDGRVLEVVLLQANGAGEIRHPWPIPLDGRVVAVASVSDVRRDGVEQAPASIGIPGDEIKVIGDGDNGDDASR